MELKKKNQLIYVNFITKLTEKILSAEASKKAIRISLILGIVLLSLSAFSGMITLKDPQELLTLIAASAFISLVISLIIYAILKNYYLSCMINDLLYQLCMNAKDELSLEKIKMQYERVHHERKLFRFNRELFDENVVNIINQYIS